MIFVTVGTTHFDKMIEEIDRLKQAESIESDVVCQIGSGKYEPQFCEFFRFRPSLEALMDQADLVICHGGTGSVLSLLKKQKRFVALANIELADDHQTKFLTRLGQSVAFPWGREVGNMKNLIETALGSPPASISMPHLADELRQLI